MVGENNTLSGIVSKGVGDGAFFMSLEPYIAAMEEKLGFRPFKGTLNLKVDAQEAQNFTNSLKSITIEGFKKGIKQFGKVECYPCELKQLKCAIIIPEFTRYGPDTVELISEKELRKTLNLKDGDKITISKMKIGIADTTFSRVDMSSYAIDTINKNSDADIIRYTVPGIKDLPVACLKLFAEDECDIVMALGMAGPEQIDKQCAHEASTAIQKVQLMVKKHILEVFVHMDESEDEKEIFEIAKNRAEKHALNALELLKDKTTLTPYAGTGRRQGKEDEGPINIK